MIQNTNQNLITPFEGDTDFSWDIYPRPQARRESFLSLSGEWDLSVKTEKTEENLGKITVPFPPESRISGIFREKKKNERYVYRKAFSLDSDFGERVILHFGAADQKAVVYLNGAFIGSNTGGYLPFSFDITDALTEGENELLVEIEDSLDKRFGYGKQKVKRGGMWYTPISGLWQSVWIEGVPENHIKSIRLTPTLNSIKISVSGGEEEKKILIKTDEGAISRIFTGSETEIEIPNPSIWSPENPYLYNFKIESGKDTVYSYFALRTIEVAENKILLNGKPYFFHGLLDQGYFSDGIYTPASPRGYIHDIKEMKKLGFNTLRKHIKIEPDIFYYYCDRYGMIVFQDMVNSGGYNFLIDTALPTIGIKRGITHFASKKRRKQFLRDSIDTIDHLYNHPSVCYYTIFNEGWGQHSADSYYKLLKEKDPTRIWDSTSGWFFEKESDVRSEHIYFKKIKLKPSRRPIVLSEFGGYSLNIEGHHFNLKKVYGYKKFSSSEDLSEGLYSLYKDEVIPAIKSGLTATILTQVSDVEDETNGLLTYDRQVLKVNPETMQKISEEIQKTFSGENDG